MNEPLSSKFLARRPESEQPQANPRDDEKFDASSDESPDAAE